MTTGTPSYGHLDFDSPGTSTAMGFPRGKPWGFCIGKPWENQWKIIGKTHLVGGF